jgi:prephenate dehydratase
MKKIHIVGAKHSFTHETCNLRYPENQGDPYEFISHKHRELVLSLVEEKIPIDEPAIVPLWNSNTGTVEMTEQNSTVKLFTREAGIILDMYPQQIIFKLAVKNGAISSKSHIYSVKVAKEQCYGFLKKHNILNPDQFQRFDSTTDAADAFIQSAKAGDGLLCSEKLLKDRKITSSDEDVTNPNNFTIFSTFNKMPVLFPSQHKVSLGCISVGLEGNELPIEFIDYYKSMLLLPEIEQTKNAMEAMPKILFILRYDESKALMLMEMDGGDSKNSPWEEPEIESGLDFYDEVGKIFEPFSLKVSELFKGRFANGDECVFYGFGLCYMWVCPALNISVHGYDKDLVRACANVQVRHLKSLLDSGVDLPKTSIDVLRRFEENPDVLKLSPDSVPDSP